MKILLKLTALGNITHSIVNYKLMRPVSILRQTEEKKQANCQIQKLSEKCLSHEKYSENIV